MGAAGAQPSPQPHLKFRITEVFLWRKTPFLARSSQQSPVSPPLAPTAPVGPGVADAITEVLAQRRAKAWPLPSRSAIFGPRKEPVCPSEGWEREAVRSKAAAVPVGAPDSRAAASRLPSPTGYESSPSPRGGHRCSASPPSCFWASINSTKPLQEALQIKKISRREGNAAGISSPSARRELLAQEKALAPLPSAREPMADANPPPPMLPN